MKENLRTILRCTSVMLVIIAALVSAPVASAHVDPSGATATGVSVSLTAFRADGVTPVLPGNIFQCETIIYRATLAYNTDTSNGINAAFEGGTIMIDPPGAAPPVDVTPAGGVPCIGGDDIAEGCDPSVDSITSNTVQFTANVTGCTGTPPTNGGTLIATVIYSGGTAHVDSDDQGGVGGNTPFPIDVVCCAQDGLHCNGVEFCDPTVVFDEDVAGPGTFRQGTCADGPDVTCNSDNNLCNGPEVCDETTDACISAGPNVDCTNAFFCSAESCDPATGQCVAGAADRSCDDNNICTGDVCDETLNACVNTFDETLDPSCAPGDEICRTPGFFGSHGGAQKEGSQNITFAILDAYNDANAGNPLNICGTDITNTTVGSVNSALEAICVSPKGDSRLQLARQLTAAALNCILTRSSGDPEALPDECSPDATLTGSVCAGVSIEAIFDACNAGCLTGVTADVDLDGNPATPDVAVPCIAAIDCFNNGLVLDENGECTDVSSGCHDADLDNGCFDDFTPPGPAGSPKLCNDARKNLVTIFPSP